MFLRAGWVDDLGEADMCGAALGSSPSPSRQ